jgi:hypothetical protein
MPILASSTYVNAYGKSSSGVVAVTTAAPMDSTQGTQDAFVVKYDTAGKSVWSARIGSTGADVGYGIATDTSGNVYVTGQTGSGIMIGRIISAGTSGDFSSGQSHGHGEAGR